jgi:hypothetical protein
VLDGATGGNNAFAILALLAAFQQTANTNYLNDARTIGRWITGNLTDSSTLSYGGYFVGYPDEGQPKVLETGKSVENNADIFAALSGLAQIETEQGNTMEADNWTTQANVAGDFVMAMFDSVHGRFNAGTVPEGTTDSPGISPDPTTLRGNEMINTNDFLDSNTFTTLALAQAPRYTNQIDWRRPVEYVLANFSQTVTAAGQTFQGFNIVSTPVSGADGIAWEFTGQTVIAMRLVDRIYTQTVFEAAADEIVSQISLAQTTAPYSDGMGLVASTLQNGDMLPLDSQCLDTPFQCIPERIGLGATVWAIFADEDLNPLAAVPTRPVIPTIAPDGGIFRDAVQVMLSCVTTSATIRYTTDGTDPTTDSPVYSDPFTLTNSAIVKATAFINGQNPSAEAVASFTVVAAGVSSCTLVLSASRVTLPAKGGSKTVRVKAVGTDCSWTAMSNDPFITITSGSSGTGNGKVEYTVLGNTNTTSLTGTMMIAGQTYTVNQDAGGCIFKLSPKVRKLKANGGTGTVKVTPNLGDCDWTAVSSNSFVTITSGTSGTGKGTVTYTVPANLTENVLNGTIIIGGETFTVIQAGTK